VLTETRDAARACATNRTRVSAELWSPRTSGAKIVDYGLNPFCRRPSMRVTREKLSARYAFPRLWQLERSHGSFLRRLPRRRRARAPARARARPTGGSAPDSFPFRHGLQALPRRAQPLRCRPVGAVQTRAPRSRTSFRAGPWEKIINLDGATTKVETSEFGTPSFLALPAAGAPRSSSSARSAKRPLRVARTTSPIRR